MAFRTDGLGKAYSKAQGESIRAKVSAQKAVNALAAGSVSANAIIGIMSGLKSTIEVWDEVAALPGIVAYAQNEENDPAYAVAAEFLAMRTEAIGARDWILSNFPSSGGYIQKDSLNPDGSITVRQFTPAETAGLQSALNQLIATIATV